MNNNYLTEANLRDLQYAGALISRILRSSEEHNGRLVREEAEARKRIHAERIPVLEDAPTVSDYSPKPRGAQNTEHSGEEDQMKVEIDIPQMPEAALSRFIAFAQKYGAAYAEDCSDIQGGYPALPRDYSVVSKDKP